MARLIRFYKPFRVLSQFTDAHARATLARYINLAGVYPAGRLDFDSEGLLLLTDDGALQARIADPRHKLRKTYCVQVGGRPDGRALARLVAGVALRDGTSRAVSADAMVGKPSFAPRDPPVPERHAADSTWLTIVLDTGKNRQVRRMLAAIGHPVLRLIRTRIGPWTLDGLEPGQWCEEAVHLPGETRRRAQSSRHSADRR